MNPFAASAVLWLACALPAAGAAPRLQPYIQVLREQGKDPARFVVEKLEVYDLLIFDDALHTAVEPFVFYQRLVEDPSFRRRAPIIFIEAIPSNKQRHIDEYLSAPADDPRLLYPAFQDDVSGSGFPYRTYFNLLAAIRAVNLSLPVKERLAVFAVGSPTFWKEIQTPRDLEQFHKSLASYDHHMYAEILEEMDQFRSGKKGIFLTNTRHAYKGIKSSDGQLFWDTGTFFTQRHPGKTLSIRMHNVALSIQKLKTPSEGTSKTAQGLEEVEYKFVRMARGLWDSAFRANGDAPIAIPIAGNIFGEEPYIGNHQLDALPGQKMQDAYDALIFLGPIETMRQTAFVDFIYTAAFKEEMKRRLQLSNSQEQLAELLKESHAATLDEYLKGTTLAVEEKPLPQARGVGPIDEWKSEPVRKD